MCISKQPCKAYLRRKTEGARLCAVHATKACAPAQRQEAEKFWFPSLVIEDASPALSCDNLSKVLGLSCHSDPSNVGPKSATR